MPRKFKRRQILQASLAATASIGVYDLSAFGKGSTEHVEAYEGKLRMADSSTLTLAALFATTRGD